MTVPPLRALLRSAIAGFGVGLVVLLSTGALLAMSGVAPPVSVSQR
jgi:hypothetical protein